MHVRRRQSVGAGGWIRPFATPLRCCCTGGSAQEGPSWQQNPGKGGKALFGVGALMQPAPQHLLGARSWHLLPKRPLPAARCCTTCSVLGKSALFIARVKGD